MKKLLEVCVDSLASARAAIAGGADRLELCSALCIGGLTPYAGLLHQIRAESDIEIRCMIRPRPGDFHYSADELALMLWQIRQLQPLGANGFVFGCLTVEGDLDLAAMEQLLQAAGDSRVTLHRAIDVSRDPELTYGQAAGLGIDTVLTSGGARSCREGRETIERLLDLQAAANGPQVLIGAGVHPGTITEFRSRMEGAVQFHLSGKRMVESAMIFRRADVPMGLPGLDEWHIQQTDLETIRTARRALDREK